MLKHKKTIIITGGSSGLGLSLALEYSNASNKIFLFGRSKSRLIEASNLCKIKGASVEIVVAEITNTKLMQDSIQKILNNNKVDIVIACAGISGGTTGGMEPDSQVKKIFDTNINGVLNTITPIIPHMIKKRSGNIAVISSMAGLLGLSSAPSYSASKGAIRMFSEAIRPILARDNVVVSTVIPGFIDTPMTKDNNFPMPFIISPKKAACIIKKGIDNNKQIIAFPLISCFILKLIYILPATLVSYVNSKLPGKPPL